MTQEEMRTLQLGDIVKDVESTGNWGRTVLCEVIEVEENGVVLSSLKEQDKGGYPHRFYYDRDWSKLKKVIIEK